MNIQTLIKHYNTILECSINGITATPEDIYALVESCGQKYEIIGRSVEQRPIYSIELGKGKKCVMMWTQMHGNEPTATGAVFDLINFLNHPGEFYDLAERILYELKIVIIPMLNPDGSLLHRRTNALDIDLNRDAVALQAPESRILRKVRDAFNPKYCFNLHDQTDVYNVSGTGNTATISFLAPAEDLIRSITPRRKESMAIINAMSSAIQPLIPSHVGRYSDEFYPTATGDNFQKDGFVTMLIESGVYPSDNERFVSRKCNFVAILSALEFIMSSEDDPYKGWENYDDIPRNDNKMLDLLLKNVKISKNETVATVDIGIMYVKTPDFKTKKVSYTGQIVNIGDLNQYYGIREVNLKGLAWDKYNSNLPALGDEIKDVLGLMF